MKNIYLAISKKMSYWANAVTEHLLQTTTRAVSEPFDHDWLESIYNAHIQNNEYRTRD